MMKKLFLVGALALFGAMNAQSTGNFKLGAHFGLPTGDISEVYSVNAGVDVAYVWKVAPKFDLGITSGYSYYFVKSKYSDYTDGEGIIPLAATGQYSIDGKLFLGADLGYAFFTGKNSDGGAFYYQPKVGYSLDAKNDLYLSYKGMSKDGSTASSVNLGYAYKF